MRILVADTIYPESAAEVYGRTPGLVEAPYEAQRSALWDQFFGTSDAYVHHLEELGHEAEGVITNCSPLQAAWCTERGVPRSAARAVLGRRGRRAGPAPLQQQAVLLAQVESFRPDVVFVHDPWTVGDRALELLGARVPLLVGQLASRAPSVDRLRRFDLMLSSFPHFVEAWRREGIDSELFRLGYYERVGERLAREGVDVSAGAEGRAGVVLSGGLSPATYPTVTPMLERLCAEVDVEVWGYAAGDLPAGSAILRGYRGAAWGLDMYRRMARAAVVVNRHGDISQGLANNMRLFEATGVGAALVTESAPNLREMFEPGAEVATYSSGEELVSVVRSLLDERTKRVELAAAGQRRTLAEHTYAERMRELSALLEERLSSARRSYQST